MSKFDLDGIKCNCCGVDIVSAGEDAMTYHFVKNPPWPIYAAAEGKFSDLWFCSKCAKRFGFNRYNDIDWSDVDNLTSGPQDMNDTFIDFGDELYSSFVGHRFKPLGFRLANHEEWEVAYDYNSSMDEYMYVEAGRCIICHENTETPGETPNVPHMSELFGILRDRWSQMEDGSCVSETEHSSELEDENDGETLEVSVSLSLTDLLEIDSPQDVKYYIEDVVDPIKQELSRRWLINKYDTEDRELKAKYHIAMANCSDNMRDIFKRKPKNKWEGE